MTGRFPGRRKMPYGVSAAAFMFFAALLILFSVIISFAVTNRVNVEKLQMERLILERSHRINDVVTRHLYQTFVLSAVIALGNGDIDYIETVAASIIDDPGILNVLVAPGGVVSHVFSHDGGEARVIGLDYFTDELGNLEALLAVESGELVMAGPFMGRQGHMILAGRLPVYLDAPEGGQEFWGIVSVTLRFPQALDNVGLDIFGSHGYAYELWRLDPETGEKQIIASDKTREGTRRGYSFTEERVDIHNAVWFLNVTHINPWFIRNLYSILISIAAFCISLLIGFIVQNNYELKVMKIELEESILLARNAAEAKSMFVAITSHEIRTPLNSVIGYAELALDDEAIPAAARDYITKNLNSAISLMDMLNNLLDISKIESGKIDIDKAPFDLNELLETCESIIKPMASVKGISFDFRAEQFRGFYLIGDPTKLRQVLLNLLSNAVKFTERGIVKVSVSMADECKDPVTALFEVWDTGIGMNHEQLAYIFEAFLQADSGITREYGGTGLGLSISKNYVELMGGTLRAESVQGVGSKFSFTLKFDTVPVTPGHAARNSTAHVLENPVFTGEVLICEDNGINQDVMVKHLEMAGLTPILAANGKQGVEIALERTRAGKPFDLILMDMHMPVMDGQSASKKLRELGIKTPIVAVSADVSAKNREMNTLSGISDYLSKPFKRQELWDCLRKYLILEGNKTDSGITENTAAKGCDNDILNYSLGVENSAGSEDMYRDFLAEFYENQRNGYTQLENALKMKKYDLVGEIIHKEMGSAAVLGAGRLLAVLTDLHRALEESEPSRLDELTEVYGKELNSVLEHIKAMFNYTN